ncbi:hypothetical protein SMI01S_12130 [Sphingobacterium mizutaii NBRC 14946 = DSM 11724]|uniref:Uncharacterized protein n=2 Tax=Sphingobacterium mizutaii TaxID=1010 RepID=A0AAJ4XD50_9SPHI|nr:hypothetical protein [Sphingobacterium mizutaii]GEM67607.1 hypothetical protein SMI01S_12130 [Sphingobacterium mizutaii NBRC 14946 = DSM 11724]SDL15176.1 hypothetical protein SAMN05192578_1011547 [Sphingobacterium mizutaii]SNV52330.1 Uncharacterised protein [Sphingobacterium mizutaii]
MAEKIRLKTINNKQYYYTLVALNPGEMEIGECNMEYFDKNQIHLEDGDYPEEWFEQVILAAHIVPPGEPIPITHYRGMQLKKEYRKYKK